MDNKTCSHNALSPRSGALTERGGSSVVAKHYATFVLTSALVAVILTTVAVPSFAESRTARLNENAFAYAGELITQGHIILDKRNGWVDHHPTAQEENEFIRDHGFAEYEKWHLGIDATHAQNNKTRYKFPFGDFKNIHRCALLAVKSRAHQYGYSDIERAAEQLLKMLKGQRLRTRKDSTAI